MNSQKFIVLWLSIDALFSRNVWRGVISYARPAKPWFLQFTHPTSPLPKGAAGVIACLDSQAQLEELKKSGLPAVSVAETFEAPGIPLVTMDNVAIGRAGAKHFLERGFRHFVFVGMDYYWARRRYEGFQAELASAGKQCEYIDVTRWIEDKRVTRPVALEALLPELLRPAAIMACNDWTAWRVSERCCVPGGTGEGVAVLGVDNDDIVCESLQPAVSSVIVPSENVGYHAAAVLDGLLNGEPPPTRPMLLPPLGIAARDSTDPYANADKDVAAAMRYIRENAEKSINVDDVVQHVVISRRSLERKFQRVVGRSPLDEIYRIRMEQAQHLLSRTTLPLATIARRAGFSNAKRFSTIFASKAGVTPSAYRQQIQRAKLQS